MTAALTIRAASFGQPEAGDSRAVPIVLATDTPVERHGFVEVLDIAAHVADPGVRSLDAIHLATALSLGDDLGVLLTYDARMADAARSLGLPVESPA